MRTLVARYAGTCALCGKVIIPGHPITRGAALDGSDDQESYQHVWCAVEAKRRYRVASGETFAGHKRAVWRRKEPRRQ
jgi:hypothetical protein